MRKVLYPAENEYVDLSRRPAIEEEKLFPFVQAIIEDVGKRGDEALRSYTRRFDGVKLKNMRVAEEEFDAAEPLVPEKLKAALAIARDTVARFHEAQQLREEIVKTAPGVSCWRRSLPIEKIGLYAPAGSAPLFSTFLMLAVPATIAGCREIIVCTPPNKEGRADPVVLYLAKLLGINQIFKAGGAQAIAALGLGTQTIPAVYKICGPGNQYVTAAKRLMREHSMVEIDIVSGPSEVLVVADETCPPSFAAADLIAQAEHNPDSQTMLVSTSEEVVDAILKEIEVQLEDLPRKDIASQSLANGLAIVTRSTDEALAFSNVYAPEHLILAVKKPAELSEKVTNAGSVFLGIYSPESAGDYASGTNHCLPTLGFARVAGGVSLDTFVKKVTFQQLTREGLNELSSYICEMAAAEGLVGHSRAVTVRLKQE